MTCPQISRLVCDVQKLRLGSWNSQLRPFSDRQAIRLFPEGDPVYAKEGLSFLHPGGRNAGRLFSLEPALELMSYVWGGGRGQPSECSVEHPPSTQPHTLTL